MSKTLQTWFVTNNLTRTEYLELWLVSLTQTPHVDITPSFYIDSAPPKMREITTRIQNPNPTHITSKQKTRSYKDEA